jgi:hypothetical protein
MNRHPDGTFRNPCQPAVVSAAVRRARWVEAETVHLKRMGLSFDAIAEQLARVGRGLAQALTTIPQGLQFPPDYAISKQACARAFQRALAREPALELEELRRLDSERCEEMFMNLQPGIRKGNARIIEVAIKVLGYRAKINGFVAPQKHEVTGKDGKPLTLIEVLDALGPLAEDDHEK